MKAVFIYSCFIWSLCAFMGSALDKAYGFGVMAVAIICSMFFIGYHIYTAVSSIHIGDHYYSIGGYVEAGNIRAARPSSGGAPDQNDHLTQIGGPNVGNAVSGNRSPTNS